MSRTPKRYQFSNHLPVPREPAPLPTKGSIDPLVQHPETASIEAVSQPPQIVHVHHAPPDRTLARLALGAGVGAGAVGAGVYFAPVLVVLVQSMVIGVISMTLALAVAAWAVVTVVNAVSGKGRRR